ncbi:MAG: mechanosensitive ion channel family protein [Gemmatimonadales bacterium]|nr:MAG: mechanosensitive ion channel family protein [Gemmatimonadales bacterium]
MGHLHRPPGGSGGGGHPPPGDTALHPEVRGVRGPPDAPAVGPGPLRGPLPPAAGLGAPPPGLVLRAPGGALPPGRPAGDPPPRPPGVHGGGHRPGLRRLPGRSQPDLPAEPQGPGAAHQGLPAGGQVVAHLAGLILLIATLMDRSPLIFLSGLGAMTAVLLLVFRDTLLSLVAGIQITMNDLIRAGDWIEMPQFQANGAVIDIALNSITVQNWDRTLSSIPTHKFLEHSFKNWRGMVQSGGRRMMRSIYLDQQSIRFLTDEEVEAFGKWELLRDYMAQKRQEVEAWNREHPASDDLIPQQRRLTNVGTLRAYLVAYLQQHPGLHPEMMTMVRQLDPTPEGVPMEIYGFANTTEWAIFEGIQGDIFDHVMATVPEFGLRLYQKPSGLDVQAGVGAAAGAAST